MKSILLSALLAVAVVATDRGPPLLTSVCSAAPRCRGVHAFRYVVLPFGGKHAITSLWTSSLVHGLLRSNLVSKYLRIFPEILLVISSSIPLWSENIFSINLILLNTVRPVLCSQLFHTHLRRMSCTLLGGMF